MHDIRSIRDNPRMFDEGLAKRGLEPLSAQLIALDDERKAAISALQAATETRNALSKEIGQAKAKKDEARAQELMAQVSALKESLPQLEEQERAAGESAAGSACRHPEPAEGRCAASAPTNMATWSATASATPRTSRLRSSISRSAKISA